MALGFAAVQCLKVAVQPAAGLCCRTCHWQDLQYTGSLAPTGQAAAGPGPVGTCVVTTTTRISEGASLHDIVQGAGDDHGLQLTASCYCQVSRHPSLTDHAWLGKGCQPLPCLLCVGRFVMLYVTWFLSYAMCCRDTACFALLLTVDCLLHWFTGSATGSQ